MPLPTLQEAKANRSKADAVRAETAEALRLAEERKQQRKKEMDALRKQRGEKDQEAVNRLHAANAGAAEAGRQQREARRKEREAVRPSARARSSLRPAPPSARAGVPS